MRVVANAYDADAETVTVKLPLGTEMARKDKETGKVIEPSPPWGIEVTDDGHGMTPGEAKRFYLEVGRDRRTHPDQGPQSREKQRAVMGRKGIGKLAPFGVCRVIEVVSSGGTATDKGYYTTHFLLEFDRIMTAGESMTNGARKSDRVPLQAGEHDGTYGGARGRRSACPRSSRKRVPEHDVFKRQLERRFTVAEDDFTVKVQDTRGQHGDFEIELFDFPIEPSTLIDLSTRPVPLDYGTELPVSGQIGMATVLIPQRGDGRGSHLRAGQDHRYYPRLRAAGRLHR